MDKELKVREKLVYTGGLMGQNMIYNFMSTYIMFFFTDLLGITPGAATAIVVAASLWDAVNDPMMGAIADKTRSRWGKFRPYLLFGPVFIGITTVLCFTDFRLGTSAVAVAAICYVLWGMSYTVCDIPIWALSSVASKNPDEKNQLVTLGKIGGPVGTAIVTVCGIMLIKAFGTEREAGAYTGAALILAVIGGLLMILTSLVMRERIRPDKEAVPIRQNLRTITRNKPLKLLMISLLIVNLVNNLRQVTQMYFVVYVWGDSGQLINVGISLIIGMCLGMAVSPKLLARFEKRVVYMWACILGFISSSLPFFVAGDSILTALLFLGASFAFTGVTTVSSTSMLMDGIDYSEWKLGFRGEGLVFSMNTLLNKFSATLAKGILGLGLVLMHYVENQPVTATTQWGFSFMMYLVPGICFLISMIPLFFYKISREEKDAISAMQKQKYQEF